jgi:Ca2+-binding RTX toxin-like protein
MLNVRSLQLACALVLVASSALHAQNPPCPNTSMMTFTPANGAAAPNLLDGADYSVWLGRTNNGAGTQVLAALIMRNGVCLPPMWVNFNWFLPVTQLAANTNLCFGGGRDVVQVLSQTTTVQFCGVNMSLNAFAYGGRRLATYAGAGPDIVFGGSGLDHVFGGSGPDILQGGSGTADELYGGSGGDVVNGSRGNITWSAGGNEADVIDDDEGFSDALSGDAGDDALVSWCNSAALFCGTGTDWAVSPDNPGVFGSCEEWEPKDRCP